jgi:branched-chain amino acid aminotransferase
LAGRQSHEKYDLLLTYKLHANKPQIAYDELKSFDEVLAAGTAAALVPIKTIVVESRGDKFTYPAAEKEPGPVCVKLLSTLRGFQQGKLEDKRGWLFKVEKPEQFGKTQTNSAQAVGQLP